MGPKISGNCEAEVPERKITDYLLCEDHPVGGAKARYFVELGYSRDNPVRLKEDLLAVATGGIVVEDRIKEHDVIRELETVVLTRDLAEYGLSRGDIGAVVHLYESGAAFEVEFVTGNGETVAVVMLNSEDVRPMRPNEILHVRKIKAA
ncbi:MAG: DUF4926 domain-containing protein [Syntrophobacteraceae bacterium]